ncbi:hypothetical protein NLI96_g12716 [Meripilus lineatus]|uniref:Enhancer of polycomb-like protein n=1 Tax=Meripilus lineatus TaxID=2056292 RepID=A0AAD5UPE1_9APHY|nr:hypothetical protein NLI96_g12716 [Physisporinus lineatus]
MPRNHNAGPSTLRNRNRVTNKTRLKVIKEAIDADPIVLDEDEEKARVVSTAGVDAEDANVSCLTVFFDAAGDDVEGPGVALSDWLEPSSRATPKNNTPAAYIPTPDSTGVVDNYTDYYPSGKWKDTVTYLKSSDTVEEATSFALANGFIYFMDERDKEWLDKNNEEARGEGTSAQGSVSGTSTRSGRSAKAKGKDPEVSQPVAMSEDEFELVMAIFEKVTHEKTEFLHHGLEQGSPFPPFSDYQDAFAMQPQDNMFALYAAPSWLPPSPQLLRLAKALYPHWRERRMERGGHPIIPVVNLDETDTLNESYICFRRREIKAVRKTRAQQATYSDKMVRLQAELTTASELVRGVLTREAYKKDVAVKGQDVWEKRFGLMDLKRKFPALGSKEDDELFYDKERVSKKPKADPATRIPLKFRPNGEFSPLPQEPVMKPKDRQQMIQKQVEADLAQRKNQDHLWEDSIDNSYQSTPTTYSSRLFKAIAASRTSPSAESASSVSSSSTSGATGRYRAARLRWGRGGRMHLDRHLFAPRRSRTLDSDSGSEEASDLENNERRRRLEERWKFDDDDSPSSGPPGSDEQTRKLVDNFKSSYLPHYMTLFSDQDHQSMSTDATLTYPGADGRMQTFAPFRMGNQFRRELPNGQRLGQPPMASPNALSLRPPNGTPVPASARSQTPVPVSTPVKGTPPPSIAQMRMSANGVARISSPNTVTTTPSVPSQSPVQAVPSPSIQVNGNPEPNGVPAVAVAEPEKMVVNGLPNGVPKVAPESHPVQPEAQVPIAVSTSPARLKANQLQPTPMPTLPNGYHLSAVNGYATAMPNGSPYIHPGVRANALQGQQLQTLKAAFNLPVVQEVPMQPNGNHLPMRPAQQYISHVTNGAAYNAQLMAARQMQHWQAQVVRQNAANMIDANGMDASLVSSLPAAATPTRVPSSNGTRGVSVSRAHPSPALAHAMSPPQGRASPVNPHLSRLTPHSPSPHLLSPSLAASQVQQSPTRQPQAPMPSPSLQSRQVIGSSGAGY